MRNTYWDRDYYSIYEVNGEKYIKFWGYFYDGCDDEEKPYRCLEFVGAEIPLEDYLKDRGISIEDGWSSYIGDMTEDEAIAAMNRYYNGNPPEPYPIQDVTMETPCGDYVDAIFYEKEKSMTNKEAVENNYEMDGKDDGMTVSLYFDKDNIAYLKKKFDIENKESLLDAIYECISTYMEL